MAKVVNPIPDWDKKQNTCFFCKSNKSVKYMLSYAGQDFPVCNACMLKIATKLWEGKDAIKKEDLT